MRDSHGLAPDTRRPYSLTSMGFHSRAMVTVLALCLAPGCTERSTTPTAAPPTAISSAPSTSATPTKVESSPNATSDPPIPAPRTDPPSTDPRWSASTGPYGLIRLDIPGFGDRTLREKRFAYHLAQAALAGRDITVDQRHRHGLAIRQALEMVLRVVPPKTLPAREAFQTYAHRFWIANGPYEPSTGEKIRPEFNVIAWRGALKALEEAGKKVTLLDRPDVEKLLFDPHFDPLLTARKPQAGTDRLLASGNNLYVGVTMRDLSKFDEQYPSNSRLVKRNGVLVEEVYRAGRSATSDQRPAPPGRYASSLRRVCLHLRSALPFASAGQRVAIQHLIDHLETGRSKAFDRFNVAWLQDESPVQVMAGFIETGSDVRGAKGEWEATVMVRDERVHRWMERVEDQVQEFEDRSPWADAYKKTWKTPSVPVPMEVVMGSGATGPILPVTIHLPNKVALRGAHGSRTLLLTNVMRAIDGAVRERSVGEFTPPHARAAIRKYGRIIDELEVVLHEVLGHGSGRVAPRFEHQQPAVRLKEFAAALEEARAMLVTLHHLWDPKVRTIAPECPDECAAAAYQGLVTHDLMMLRWVHRDRIEDAHRRAVHLIVHYAASKGAVERVTVDGKIFQVVSDLVGMRRAVSDLLRQVMRAKAEGDYEAAKVLFETHGMVVDSALRTNVHTRAKAIGLPSRYAFIMPTLKRVKDAQGTVVDVVVEPPESFEAQMLRWGREHPRHP
jgi:dipeptidyl-peptidase-3